MNYKDILEMIILLNMIGLIYLYIKLAEFKLDTVKIIANICKSCLTNSADIESTKKQLETIKNKNIKELYEYFKELSKKVENNEK